MDLGCLGEAKRVYHMDSVKFLLIVEVDERSLQVCSDPQHREKLRSARRKAGYGNSVGKISGILDFCHNPTGAPS